MYEIFLYMLTFSIAMTIVLIFFYISRNETIEVQSYLAVGLMASYLALYVFVPPHMGMVSDGNAAGKVFGIVSLLSFIAILLPSLNQYSSQSVTRTFGWSGLIGVSLLLCLYKLFVWK